jgi:hypothetical protein
MLLAGVCVSVWIDNHVVVIDHYVGVDDYWGFSIAEVGTLWLAGFGAGCIVNRWRAVLLALLPILVAVPFGLPDYDGWQHFRGPVAYYLAVLAPFCAGFIAAGVAFVTGIQATRQNRSAPAAG